MDGSKEFEHQDCIFWDKLEEVFLRTLVKSFTLVEAYGKK